MKKILGIILFNKFMFLVSILIAPKLAYKMRLNKASFLELFIGLILAVNFTFDDKFTWSPFLVIDFILTCFLVGYFRRLKIVGVTGTMGSGKSTLIKMISYNYQHITIIDMDKITRGLFKQSFFIQKVKKILKG